MRLVVALIISSAVALIAGCRQPTAPSPAAGITPPTAPTGPAPIPPREPVTFEIFGIVAEDSGAPVTGAKVTVVSGFDGPFVFTNAEGFFRLEYAAVPGSEYHPGYDAPGTRESIGFLQVEAPGYERFARHILARGSELVENVRLHRVSRVAAGASAMVTIRPEDTVCVVDAWPGRELTCGIVRIDVPSAGILRVEAAPTQPGALRPSLVVYGSNSGAPRENPTSLKVEPGEYFVNVEVRWGEPTQSFVVTTSLAASFR